MSKLFDITISGAVTGAIYAIMAAGLVLTYQTSGIFNFAHGAVAFTVAYLYYQLHVGQDIPIVPSAIIAVFIFAPALGLLLDRILLHRLAQAPVYARIVGTIGLLVALPNLALWLVESVGNGLLGLDLPTNKAGEGVVQPPGIGPSPPKQIRISDQVALNSDQIAVLACAVAAAVILWIVLRKTRIGLEMRAVVDREELAQLRGVNAARSSALAWILTMILAGLGGILIAPLFSLDDTTMTFIVLGSLAAVALARLRSIPIALLGGLLLGIVANLVAGYSDDVLPDFLSRLSGLRSSVPYVITLLLLMFWMASRKRERAAGTIADDAPRPDHRTGLSPLRRRLPWAVATVGLIGYAFGWFRFAGLQADRYEQGLIALSLTMGLIFLSFVVVTGIGGMVSLAQATFVTAGGLAAGWSLNHDWGIDLPLIASHGQLNFFLAAAFGGLVGAAVGLIVALPVRRLGGVSIAIGTLAIAFAAEVLVFGQPDLNNDSAGWFIRSPTLDLPVVNWINDLLVPGHQPFIDLSRSQDQIVVGLVVFGIAALGFHALLRSATGRAMLAVRSSQVAATSSGISSSRTTLLLFALTGGIAGLGGAFLGVQTFIFTQTSARPYATLFWLALAVTFGIRRPGGALLAGFALVCSPALFQWIAEDVLPRGSVSDLLSSPYFVPILSGIAAINLAQEPDGILALAGHQRLARRRRRERAAAIEAAEAAMHDGIVPEHERSHARADGIADLSAVPLATGVAAASLEGAALAFHDIVAGYGDVEILHGVSLGIAPGSIVALLGANGAGKSTLCATASGLLPPIRGSIRIDGDEVTEWPAFARARTKRLQLVPEARGIFPGLSVEDNLRVLLRDPALRELAYDRFPILKQRRRQNAGLLSGGEQQMLSLAPALADPPHVLIADEPALGLSPIATDMVMAAIVELRAQGTAVLLVEENVRHALEVADLIAVMELGRIAWCGPRGEADVTALGAAYLGARLPGDAPDPAGGVRQSDNLR
jgi:ABC-type branched-subunit amino acid transport system ATPase component/branched-subunit amino acid ABC-type transport system permease component